MKCQKGKAGRLCSRLFRGQAVSEDYTKGQAGGGNEEEKKKGVSVAYGRIHVPHLARAVHDRPCHPLHDGHSQQGEGVHEAGHKAYNGKRGLCLSDSPKSGAEPACKQSDNGVEGSHASQPKQSGKKGESKPRKGEESKKKGEQVDPVAKHPVAQSSKKKVRQACSQSG